MKTTQICSNCKHWTPFNKKVNDIQIGECNHPMIIHPNYGEEYLHEMITSGLITANPGGDTGVITTGPEFGCVHFDRNCGVIGRFYYPKAGDLRDTIFIQKVDGDDVEWTHNMAGHGYGVMSKYELLRDYTEVPVEEYAQYCEEH